WRRSEKGNGDSREGRDANRFGVEPRDNKGSGTGSGVSGGGQRERTGAGDRCPGLASSLDGTGRGSYDRWSLCWRPHRQGLGPGRRRDIGSKCPASAAGTTSASRFWGDLHGRSELYSCAGVSSVRRESDVAAFLCVSVFPGLASGCLLYCAALYFGDGSRSDHAAGGGVELSELPGGDAFLVQPVFRHVWSGGAAALPGSADAAMAVCGGSMRRSVDPDQGDRGILHCRSAAVSCLSGTERKFGRTCRGGESEE